MKRKAFTLAEVLIALALLGVVAAFTIPKVLQVTGEQEKIAKLKEAVAMLSGLCYASSLRNDLNPLLDPHRAGTGTPNAELYKRAFVDYFAANLNTLKKCYNAQAEGCWTGSTNGMTLVVVTPTAGGMVLPNGVYIVDMEDNPLQVYGDTVYIDYNGLAGPNILGDDMMGFVLYWYPESGYGPGQTLCPNYVILPAQQAANDALCKKVLSQ